MWRWILGLWAGVVVLAGAIAFMVHQVFSGVSDAIAKVIPKGRLERTTLAHHLGGDEAEASIARR